MYDARPAHEPLAKDCPHCQSNDIVLDKHGFLYCAVCFSCNMSGPRLQEREEALAAWNALPRRLRPTANAPTSGGWYYVRNKGHRHWRIIHIHEADLYNWAQFYANIETIAGPIPEPEESHDAAE